MKSLPNVFCEGEGAFKYAFSFNFFRKGLPLVRGVLAVAP